VAHNYPRSLKDEIVAEAQRLGFNLVGVTQPEPPQHVDVYEDWLNAGRHGEMKYLSTERARARRANPSLILPECKSILVLGMDHPVPDISEDISGGQLLPDQSLKGKIAAYAWGEDYHDVIPRCLRELVAFIETQVGEPVANRWYTDTGPILERELAQQAGLGWIGKNTCLINPAKGSFFLLAELFLSIDLEPDQPFTADRCGTCRRCLEACPTACILPDRTIDASRCLSYLTIELKGPIPVDLRPQMDNWIFGCDICQQVCPWNQRFARQMSGKGIPERDNLTGPNLIAEISLSTQEFNRKFKGSPMKRTKRRGYLRNISVALGNSRHISAAASLVKLLADEPEPLVRGHTAWALGKIQGDLAQEALEKAAAAEEDPYVLGEINAALGQ
jgi:epoxyqueuosine reductase